MNSHKLEKKVTLIIISHKSKKKIKKIINNIKNFKNIIVVDNSNDKSLVYLKKKKIQFFATKNKGYGAAINYASKFVKTKYFLCYLTKKILIYLMVLMKNFFCFMKKMIFVKEVITRKCFHISLIQSKSGIYLGHQLITQIKKRKINMNILEISIL
jgi:UTP-glucose-1-phosphate uridylyltransferase